VDTVSHNIFRVTSAKFGAIDPDFTSDKSRLLYSDYCSDGLMISEARLDSTTWEPVNKVKNQTFRLYDILAQQEGVNLQDTLLNEGLFRMLQSTAGKPDSATLHHPQYSSKKYSKAAHLFNIHSWAPASFSVSNLTLHPGVMALSQNVLSTAFASAGYDWDYNERTGQFFLNFSYQGLFPVFDLNASYGKRAGYYTTSKSAEKTRFTWNEFKAGLTVSVPLNFTRRTWLRNLTPSAGFYMTDVIHDNSTPGVFTNGWINLISYNLTYYQYKRSNYQDMYYRWARILNSLSPTALSEVITWVRSGQPRPISIFPES